MNATEALRRYRELEASPPDASASMGEKLDRLSEIRRYAIEAGIIVEESIEEKVARHARAREILSRVRVNRSD